MIFLRPLNGPTHMRMATGPFHHNKIMDTHGSFHLWRRDMEMRRIVIICKYINFYCSNLNYLCHLIPL